MTISEDVSTIESLKQDHVAIDVVEEDSDNDEEDKTKEDSSPLPKRGIKKDFGISSDHFDNQLLRRAVSDAGRWAYGTILVEVWALSDDHTCLFRPDSGWWIDPVYHCDCHDENCQICRLTNSNRSDFLPPEPVTPGEGLPGMLWSEAGGSWFHSHGHTSERSLNPSFGSFRRRVGHGSAADAVFPDLHPRNRVMWREVKAIADDPDQPWNPRLQVLASLGLGWVAAIPFNHHGHQGIVIYMARDGVDLTRLKSHTNEDYLMVAADLAGVAYALRGPRRRVVDERHAEMHDTAKRVREKMLMLVRSGVSLKKVVQEEAEKKEAPQSTDKTRTRLGKFLKPVEQKVVTTLKKTRGGGVHPPPPSTWKQTILTFIGVFVTLLMVTRLNVHLLEEYGSDWTIVLGPFGAFMTLLYGLTAAPASQPRNAMIGQMISLSISLAVSQGDGMALWLRQSLATALAVASMAKLGVTHPPAGAAALIFASGQFGWGNMVMMLVGNVIAIGGATLINNYSEKRQYPSYWGIGVLEALVQGRKKDEAEKNQNVE